MVTTFSSAQACQFSLLTSLFQEKALMLAIQNISAEYNDVLIKPRCACTARVTALGLCVCVCVCLCVSLLPCFLPPHATTGETTIP